MARPLKKTENDKEIVQSNYVTTARYDYSAQEKRILYRIVEKAYEYRIANLDWFKQNDGKFKIKEHKVFTMPITAFMNREQLENGSGQCYNDVVEGFESLVDKKIRFKGNDEFSFGGILNFADREKGEGNITFMVHKFVWQSALDFSKGFTKLDLITAMELKSAYSMRFYELIKSWEDRMHFSLSVEEFRTIFGCVEKYPRLESLKRCVIDTAKEELDRISPISFAYEQVKQGRKVVRFDFHLYRIGKNIPQDKQRKVLLSKHPQGMLPDNVKEWLTNKMQLNQKQRESNIVLFDNFCSIFKNDTITELEETFQYISKQGCRPQENVGWFIQNLKKKLENATEGISTTGKEQLDSKLSDIYSKFNSSKK